MYEVTAYLSSPEHVRFMASRARPDLIAAITGLEREGHTVIY